MHEQVIRLPLPEIRKGRVEIETVNEHGFIAAAMIYPKENWQPITDCTSYKCLLSMHKGSATAKISRAKQLIGEGGFDNHHVVLFQNADDYRNIVMILHESVRLFLNGSVTEAFPPVTKIIQDEPSHLLL